MRARKAKKRDLPTTLSKSVMERVKQSLRRLKRFRARQERAPKPVQPYGEPPYQVPRWAHAGWRKRWQVRAAQRRVARA